MAATSRRIEWRSLFVEAFFIVFAVLLALGVNEWRDERRLARTVEQAERALANELRSNRAQLDTRVAYYRALRDTTRAMLTRGELPPDDRLRGSIPGWRGLSPPLLTDAAYEVALATEALSHMDYELALGLAQVYAFQALYQKMLDQFMDQMIAGELSTLRDVNGMFGELGQLGGELSRVYGQVLEALPPTTDDEAAVPANTAEAG